MKTGKWQIAEQKAFSFPLKRSLHADLLAEHLFVQASEFCVRHCLQGQVGVVTTDQMTEQLRKEESMFLQLPPCVLAAVIVVDDEATLQRAAASLLPAEELGVNPLFFVGVDAEWRAVVTKKPTGASILQVCCCLSPDYGVPCRSISHCFVCICARARSLQRGKCLYLT